MVESAPQDRKRLLPSMAKPIDPAMKAKKPIWGEKPPSRAVAICSGIAIAASVRPAIRSPGRSLSRNESSERNTGQLVFAAPSAAVSGVIDPGLCARRSILANIPISRGQKPAMSGVTRRGDGFTDRRQRSRVVEFNAFALRFQAEGAPERREIGLHGFGPHLVVKPREHVDADGLVGGSENALERPVLLVIAAGR